MLKRLQVQFILVIMSIVIVILSAMESAAFLYLRRSEHENAYELLEELLVYTTQSDYIFNGHEYARIIVAQRIKTDLDDVWNYTFDDLTYNTEQCIALARAIDQYQTERGRNGNFLFVADSREDIKTIIIMDRTAEAALFKRLVKISVIISGICIALLALIVTALSFWIVRPVKQAALQQHRFISDAGHELKTPITVIAANAEVLKAQTGKTKWLDNIISQNMRMGALAENLLKNADTNRLRRKRTLEAFNVSKTVAETAESYRELAARAQRPLNVLCGEYHIIGDAHAVKQALEILIDNAVKYSIEGSTVNVSLSKPKTRVVLEVSNKAAPLTKTETELIFERFYRTDYSRASNTGGNGLGLAILKNIAETNKWRLKVKRGNELIIFAIAF